MVAALKVAEVESFIPVLVFLAPIVVAAAILAVGTVGAALRQWLGAAGLAVTLALVAVEAGQVAGGAVVFGGLVYVDGLSVLMHVIITAIGLVALLYSVDYLPRVAPETSARKLSVYYCLLLVSVGLMNAMVIVDGVVLLCVLLELSTLATVYLVAFEWRRAALEAAYKYLLLTTVGVTIALLGVILLSGAANGGEGLTFTGLAGIMPTLPRGLALFAAGLLLVGFGTKSGLIPFHAWVPDAYGEAPAPVSVLLAGASTKLGLYAIARVLLAFVPAYPEVGTLIAIIAAVTMLVGALMTLGQDDLKRLLAFLSVSEMGFIAAGLGLTTSLGLYGGYFHLLNHSVFKGLLFLCAGALVVAAGTRSIAELRQRRKALAVTGACFLVGVLANGGMPPFNGFMSELTLVTALAEGGQVWLAAVLGISGLIALVVLAWTFARIFWARPAADRPIVLSPVVSEVPALMLACMVFLAAVVLALGLLPGLAGPLLNGAVGSTLGLIG